MTAHERIIGHHHQELMSLNHCIMCNNSTTTFCRSVGMAAMTTEDREKLAVKLDADLESFVEEKIAQSKGRPSCISVMDQTAAELAEVCWRYIIVMYSTKNRMCK